MQLTDIKQIGVVGAGTMGFGIAINFALWSYRDIISTFGFRMPHEGPFRHYDLAGIWKWPADVLSRRPSDNEKIRARMAERKPWFVDPEKFDEAVEKRDREYIRRLKELYWSNGE